MRDHGLPTRYDQSVGRRRFIVHARIVEGSTYSTKTLTAATVMGVARHLAELHRAGAEVIRWEACVYESPTADERKMLEDLLSLMEIPLP